MIIMGIDPSINCTGICIYDTVTNNHTYYMIVSKCTKKMKEFKHEYITIREYHKLDSSQGEYHIKEYNKSLNIYDIVYYIKDIMHWHNVELVQMEGVSYGSIGSAALVDLSGLNFAIRNMLIYEDISFNILAPTAVKKFAVGNGSADKNVMIASWKLLDKNIKDITTIKVDDLADSYFIAHYCVNS